MTATPLQVVNVAKLGTSANATIIQWHVVAMFLPSFFTGNLIARFGALRILSAGVICYILTIIIAVNAVGFGPIVWALMLLGLGWNFCSSVAVRWWQASPNRRAWPFRGLLIFATTTTVALHLFPQAFPYSQLGWQMVSLAAIPPVIVVMVALVWLKISAVSSKPHAA